MSFHHASKLCSRKGGVTQLSAQRTMSGPPVFCLGQQSTCRGPSVVVLHQPQQHQAPKWPVSPATSHEAREFEVTDGVGADVGQVAHELEKNLALVPRINGVSRQMIQPVA